MRKDIPRKYCRYALPQMLGLLFNSVYFMVDGVFIGNRLGRDAMTAAGVAVPVLEMMIALSMAVTSGSGVLVSVALSQKRHEQANAAMMHALGAALLIQCVQSFSAGRKQRKSGPGAAASGAQ